MLPPAFHVKLAPLVVSYSLTRACDFSTIPIEAVEAVSDGNARYIGVRLEPQKAAVTSAVTLATPKHPQLSGVTEHV
jgi:hypothetical protein